MTWIYVFFQNIFQKIEVTAHVYIRKIQFNKPIASPEATYYKKNPQNPKQIIASISNWPAIVHEKALVRLLLRSCSLLIYRWRCLSSLLYIK